MKQEESKAKGLFPWDSEEQIGSLLKMASIAMRKQIEKTLRPLGLTPQQGQTLRILMHCPGSTHSDLERILCIEKSSVTSLVNGMERRQWVVRRHHPEDARVKQIYLTEEGGLLAEQIVQLVDGLKKQLDGALSSEETVILKVLLKKVQQSWEEMA
jgi:DNA-binding MarR family transcriptional regulator